MVEPNLTSIFWNIGNMMKKARGVIQCDTGSKPNVDEFWRGLPLRVDRVERVVPVRRAGRAEPINRKSD